MTDTPTPTKSRRGQAVPTKDRRRLLAVQRRIDAGRKAADERAALMAELHEDGYSYQAIADVLGVRHEVVRKAILTRTDAGYPHR